jgi:hypothetical protein
VYDTVITVFVLPYKATVLSVEEATVKPETPVCCATQQLTFLLHAVTGDGYQMGE